MIKTMITEDYCNFEISKLLKEKGFDEYCRAEWLEYISGSSKGKTYLTECGRWLQHDNCSNTSLKKFNYYNGQMFYAAPTLQMAMKWLREVHNIHFLLNPFLTKEHKVVYSINILDKEMIESLYENLDENTFEQACEIAIKYCLENLI